MRRTVILGVAGLIGLSLAQSVPSGAVAAMPQDFQDIRFIQQISRDLLPLRPDSQRDTEAGPHVAVDPNDPLRVVAVFQQSRFGGGGAADNGYATSHDGGDTWVTAPMPGLTVSAGGEWQRAQDPVVAFGPDGAAYASAVVLSNLFCPSGIAVQRSDDGGLTWNAPDILHKDRDCPGDFNDKDWIVVDTNPGSPFFGRVYVVWYRRASGDYTLMLRWSDDRGVSWSPLRAISPPEVTAISPVAVVQPDGDLTIVYADWFDDVILAQTSHDGGATFDPLVTIGMYGGKDPPDMWTGATNNRTSTAVDRTTGAIYTVWQDEQFRTDNQNDIVLTRSTDGGSTWSEPARVDIDPPDGLIDHLIPSVAAGGGFVHVTYVRRDVNDGLNQKVTQRHIVSSDGGATFTAGTQLGQPSDLTWAARFGNDYLVFYGEYLGIAATETFAFVVWPRSSRPRNIVRVYHQPMWSATIEP